MTGHERDDHGASELPPRTDEIEDREEHVGRADWNASRRAGSEQPEDTSPEGEGTAPDADPGQEDENL
jgi:hypothetical protein